MAGEARQLRRDRSIRELVLAAEAGDADARRRLVEAFLPAIAGLARGFRSGAPVERQELVQEGVAGLLVAARRYDPRLETPFWAYASYWVRKSMQELVADVARPVALSDRATRGLARVRAARLAHLREHGSEPTDEQLRSATGLAAAQLASLQAAERAPAGEERVADPRAEAAFQHVLDEIEGGELRELTERLEARERAVVRAHFGLGCPAQTLAQIGRALGVSAERARQIEVGALDKLRAALGDGST